MKYLWLALPLLLLQEKKDDLVPGLIAEYWSIGSEIDDFPDLAGRKPDLRRVEKEINAESVDGAFNDSEFEEFFATRWSGVIRLPADGTVTFFLESDDGSKLWIDGKEVVDNNGLHPMEEKSGEADLKKGDHEIRLDFFENGGNAGCKLSWQLKNKEREIVPAAAFFHKKDGADAAAPKQDAIKPGLVAEYWDIGEELDAFPDVSEKKPKLTRVEKAVEIDSTDDEFNGSGLSEHFAVRWSGLIRIPADGAYTFATESDDGSTLYIDGKVIVDNGGLHAMEEQTGDIDLKKGDHEIRLDFFENGGGAGCKLSWESKEIDRQIIPASVLFHKAAGGAAPEAPKAKRRAFGRILFLTQSVGYKHSVVDRKKEDLSHAEKEFVASLKGAFEVDCTQDASVITAANLAKYQAVAFYTTGELPISPENLRAFFDYVKSGGGFIGFHCATDTLYKSAEYGDMIGGYFSGHPWHQKINVKVENAAHPAMAHLGESFEITDEIYQFKNWDRKKLHVLASLDVKSVNLEAKGVTRTDKDFALAWCKSWGRGRVFYTALGHREEVWTDDRFRKHLLGGAKWAAGDDVDDEGFTPLFDESHVAGWKQCGPGKFKIENGVATADGGMGMWWHTKPLANYILKCEFQQDKADANSGVFVLFPDPGDDPWVAVKKGYEIQIYSSTISKNSMGSVYSAQAPTTCPAKKPGEWNEYEITVVGRHIDLRLNGTLINSYSGDRGETPGFIGFQNHGDPVKFRNIRVKELPANAAAYHVLFEGDTKGWKQCGPGEFKLADGAVTSDGGMGMLWHEKEFTDFILMLDWKVNRAAANSGIFVRFPDPANDPWIAINKGYELQICDVDPPKHRTGSVYSFRDSTEVPTLEVGEWNHYEIQVVGQKYTLRVNGRTVNEFTGTRTEKGFIGLQNHDPTSKVSFKNIRVVELKK